MTRTKSWRKKKKKKKKKRSELDGKQQCKIRPQDQAAHSIWSLLVTVPEIWPGQNSGGEKKKNECPQSHIASPTGIAN